MTSTKVVVTWLDGEQLVITGYQEVYVDNGYDRLLVVKFKPATPTSTEDIQQVDYPMRHIRSVEFL